MFDTIELTSLATGIVVGLLLGGLYFGSLWWTVSHMPSARHPLTLYFGSLIFRLAVVLAAFYGMLTRGGWPQLVATLVGFFAARLLITRVMGRISSVNATPREAT